MPRIRTPNDVFSSNEFEHILEYDFWNLEDYDTKEDDLKGIFGTAILKSSIVK